VFNVTDNDTEYCFISPTNTECYLQVHWYRFKWVVTLAGNTPSGSYSITYELCEVNPSTGLAVTPIVIALSLQ
jgi:hypothetical protein